jgi:carbon monoxide dehydrogenase subunit G
MEVIDQREVKADIATVWAAVQTAEVLRVCVPGCESMTGNAVDGFDAVVVQNLGPMKVRFTGRVTLSDLVENQSLQILGEGKGGYAGFATGVAKIALSPSGNRTLLHYRVEVTIGGRLAQMGGRIIDGLARKLSDVFFRRLQKAIESGSVKGNTNPEPV